MRKYGAASLLAAATVATSLLASPVAAATYKFTPFATDPDGLPIEVRITFANGAGPVVGTKFSNGLPGIVDFLFKMGDFEADLDDLLALQTCDPSDPICEDSILEYDLKPEAGSIYFNNTASDFYFEYNAVIASGFFNTDYIGPEDCRETGNCSFVGNWTDVAEPGSLGLLLAALGMSAGLRRRFIARR